MTASLEFFAQFPKIVNFPVTHRPDGAVFIGDRLVSAFEVNNAETAHAQSDSITDVMAMIVRPTMDNDAAHPRQHLGVSLPAWRQLNRAVYSAHSSSSVDLFFI